MKTKGQAIVYDTCVVCHEQMDVSADVNINNRNYYVEGCGQLCRNCYCKIYDSIDYVDSDSGDYENCVICNRKTKVKKATNVDKRRFYIDGVGQLCSECYFNVYSK